MANARADASAGSSRRLTTENVDCYQHPAFSDRYVCDWVTTHFKISWDSDGVYALAPDQSIDSDSNGVPESVEALRAALDDAREFYISQGFGTDADPNDPTDDPPSDSITVEFSGDPINGEGVSLPGDPFGVGSIGIPSDARVRYAAAHELFHQFQYSYATWSMVNYANWFQEASAEWAAGRYLSAFEQGVPLPPFYARSTPTFLGEPSRRLNETDGLSGPRQYGAVVFVDYFAWMYGQDFVKNVLAEFHQYGAQINEAEALEHVATGYDSNLSTDLTYFWWKIYSMCGDPGTIQSRPAARTTDPDPTSVDDQYAAYCDWYLNQTGVPTKTITLPGTSTARPAHTSVTASDTSGTWEPTVGSGGAAFLDFGDGASAHEQRRITLTITPPADFHGYLKLQPWNENPADPYSNYSCHSNGETWIDGAETVTITAKVNESCPNATAMLVATNADSVVEEWDLEGTWTARRADTNLTTGEIMLGVDELGSATSTMEGPGLVDYPWNYVGLRHITSNVELSALGAPTMWSAYLTDPNEEELVVNGAWWSTAQVQSFTYGPDHALAEVRAGDYTFIHEYSATSDPEVIRCDVTITASNNAPFGTEVRYRLGGRALTDPYATTWLTATKDSNDASIVHMNTLGMNHVDDPREYWLSQYETEAPFADWGFGEPQIDIQTGAQSVAFQPNFTFFYSASDQGEAGARSAVAQLGATSIFSYKLTDDQDATLPVGFAIGYMP